MLTREESWEVIDRIVREEGLRIFELEQPVGTRGVLRVFLSNSSCGAEGVTLAECTRVAKKINDLPNIEDLIPGECTLEVSSPGINRRLMRPEHFQGAVGERVRLVVVDSANVTSTRVVVRGVISSFDGNELVLKREGGVEGDRSSFLFSEIKDAKVDFKFE